MMRVLHCTISFEPGGRREAIRTLANEQQALGVRSDLCCASHLGCDAALLGSTFEQHVVLERRGMFDRRAVDALRRFCKARQIEVIHTHDASSQALAALARPGLPGVRVLMTFHRSLGFESARVFDRLRNAVATAACGAVVCGSRERRTHFLQENWVPRRKVVRIPFGIDLDRFSPDPSARKAIRSELGIDQGTFVFGAVGHFGEEKGIDIAIRAFAEWRQKVPAAAKSTLVVLGAGRGVEQAHIEKLATEAGAAQVLLAGFRRDVERWFNAMDAFLHVPRQEAFGLVVIEAMATRVPVIATAVGGIPDIVRPGVNGMLVQPQDITGIVAAMQAVFSNPVLREELAAGALTVARNDYSCKRYAVDYLRLYEELLAGRRPCGVDEAGVAIATSGTVESTDRQSAAMIS